MRLRQFKCGGDEHQGRRLCPVVHPLPVGDFHDDEVFLVRRA